MEEDKPVFSFGVRQPNDPNVTQQWALFGLGLFASSNQSVAAKTAELRVQSLEPNAWDITEGSDDIIVCINDSGTDTTHPDLIDNLWENQKEIPGNQLDDDGNGLVDDYSGYNFKANTPDVLDGKNLPYLHCNLLQELSQMKINPSARSLACLRPAIKAISMET